MTTHKEKIEIEVDVPDDLKIHSASINSPMQYGCSSKVGYIGLTFTFEKLPEPYVFPEWMPSGFYLQKLNSDWWICVHPDADAQGNTLDDVVPAWMAWTPPTDAQYAGKPMKVTH